MTPFTSPLTDDCLGGRVAVVTGAGRGIGLAIARRMAAAGATVHGIDLHPDHDPAIRWQALDITDETAVAAFADAHPADILVNGAAVTTRQTRIEDLSLAEWTDALTVNLTGTFLMCRATIPAMRARGGGVILNIASQLSVVAMPNRAAYSATKGAMAAFTRALAVDHAGEGIRVNTLSPGAVATERLLERHGSYAAASAKIAPLYPAGRVCTPEEVAETAVFLATDAAAFVHGANIILDGGFSIQ